MKKIKGDVFLQAVFQCGECGRRVLFDLGKIKEIWHECNTGNVCIKAPRGKLK